MHPSIEEYVLARLPRTPAHVPMTIVNTARARGIRSVGVVTDEDLKSRTVTLLLLLLPSH
jgi:hypothetical protein